CCVDVNSDGQITLEDSELIANYTLGRTNCFPAGYSCSARENCNNGKDDDCDGLVDCQQDKEDPDCNCGSSISCVGGNQLVGDMNNDGVIDIVDASFIGQIANGTREFIGSEICCADVNNDGQITMEDAEIVVNYTVGNINCFERGYSCSARENCDNNKDDDCDGLNNCDDPDCSGSPACGGTCTSDGGICTQDSDCCSGKCDSETGKCFSCASCSGINKCSNQETDECEAQCGASSACDDIHVDSYWIDNQYCKSCKDCSYTGDRTVGSCGCSTSNCKNGYCQTGTTCYYGVSCTLNGWSYSNSCSTADSCGTNTLVTGKTCGAGGCSAGTTYTCSSSSHTNCQSKSCGGKTYYCTYDGSSWAWRTSKPEESTAAGNCGDGVDNDCNTFIDCNSENEDPGCDCGGTPHYVCFDSSIYEIKYYPNTDDYMWYGDTAFGLVGIQSTTTIIRDFVRWDISSIPDNAVILSVAFKYHCTSGVTTQWGEIYEMQYDPMAHIGESQLIYTDCGDGTMYVGGRNVFPEEGEQKEISLGSDAVSKLQSNLQSDWFAIGLKVEDEASGTPDLYEIIGKTASSNPPPALCIVYTP
ncbi:MAG: dockerin type I repeat-containing protein, partial [Candidatus Diapherotrites archaeon]|nr:dockerin type I repeat-containing protein [Candidatus Diapherotrites archaeon]